ncbi:exodeoxyribonuclease III [Candidatus Poriferisodalis sp.]|uniref:exodeoxyribonuclease III n=1 Tax=Candidatus Poriferisodalis sp. TaxID=3101277 RepID=UPI003B015683
MRIATWNVNSLNARLARVDEWLAYAEPDVVLLQETKMSDQQFPYGHFAAQGYDSAHHGQGRWNGVAVLSRVGIEDPVVGFADGREPDPDARIISARCGGITVSSVYVPNGRALDHDHYRYKLDWLGRLRAHLEATCDRADQVMVGGDFNVCPDGRDAWDPDNTAPRTHVSDREREALQAVCDWGLVDVFRAHYDADGLHSWWDYREGAFYKRHGLRIDLLLASASVAAATHFCLIDRNARKGTKPSDHAPVFADISQ